MKISLKRVNTTDENNYLKYMNVTIGSPVIIGRGSLLQCADKKISRYMGVLIVKEGCLFIESTHTSPLHVKNSKETKVLYDGNTEKLCHGDQFSLCKDKFWYQIQIPDYEKEEDVLLKDTKNTSLNAESKSEIPESDADIPTAQSSKTTEQNLNENVNEKKRILPSWMAGSESKSISDEEMKEPNAKKMRTSTSAADMAEQTSVQNALPVSIPKADNEHQSDDGQSQTSFTACSSLMVDVDVAAKQSNIISPTKKPVKRDNCPYGSKCYRKNPAHWQEMAHPCDSDYKSESEVDDDDKPECEFGTKCYRKNPQHRKNYKHTRKTQPRRRVKGKVKTSGDSSSEDEYDYDDPFIDDSSDEYCPSGSETESDSAL